MLSSKFLCLFKKDCRNNSITRLCLGGLLLAFITSAANVSAQSCNTIKIEAESYLWMSGIQTETTTDTGGGLNVGWIDAGDWMSFGVTVPAAGN
jgi:hypothetical protein